MKRVTAGEIEQMKRNGYDRMTIEEATLCLERGKIADELKVLIQTAFKGVKLGDGVGLRHAQGLDDYEDEITCAAYREKDEKEDWENISADDLNSYNSSLSFFDSVGMRFHLPAFMICELDGEYGYGMTFCLTQVGNYDYYYSALNDDQRSAVREFLLFLRDDPEYEYDRPHIEIALRDYWK